MTKKTETANIPTKALPKAEGGEIKVVWKKNAECGQVIGNKQIIKPVNFEIFKKYILPITRKGWYVGKTKKEQYADLQKREPNLRVSFIDKGNGWELSKVNDLEYFIADIAQKKSWAKIVSTFDSPEAKNWRNIADSEL